MEIPGLTIKKDCFGGDYMYISPEIMSKRKAWNYLIKNGFTIQPNKRYLKKGNVYVWDNSLLNHLRIEERSSIQ